MSANQKEFLRTHEGPGDPLRVYPRQPVQVDTARKCHPRVMRPVPLQSVIARIPVMGNERSHPYSGHIVDRHLDETSHRKAVPDCRHRIERIWIVLFQLEGGGKAI